MELANDLMSALRDRTWTDATRAPAAGFTALPDWAGLHARFSAAHALRQELGRGDSRQSHAGGSFIDWPVPVGADPNLSLRVNRVDSTDGKAPWGKTADTAGLVHAGSREQ